MENCIVGSEAKKGNSKLHAQLLEIFQDQKQADLYYSKVLGEDFKKVFGDWKKAFDGETSEVIGEVSDMGEPLLKQNKRTGRYYYTKPDGTKLFLRDRGLRGAFTPQEIKEVSKYFLFRYMREGGANYVNNLEIGANKSILAASIDRAIAEYRSNVSEVAMEDQDDIDWRDEKLEAIDLVEQFKDEFRGELTYQLDALGQSVRENLFDAEGNPVDGVIEEDKGGGINIKESITVNAKNTATVNTKIFLSQLVPMELDKDDNQYYEKPSEYLGTSEFEDFNTVWETLQPLLADNITTGNKSDEIVSAYSRMRTIIKGLENVNDWAIDLGQKLDTLYNGSNNDRYKVFEFVQAFNKNRLIYNVTEFNQFTGDYKVINATSTNSRESQIVGKWGYGFKRKWLGSQQYLTTEKKDEIREIADAINKIEESFLEEVKQANKDASLINEALLRHTEPLFEQLRQLGVIGLEEQDINAHILVSGGTDKILKSTSELFAAIRYTINDNIIKDEHKFVNDEGTFINPFTAESNMKRLATAVSYRELDVAESTVLGPDGNTYFTYSNPTYINNKINEWKHDRSSLEEAAALPINASSRWLQYLLASEFEHAPKLQAKHSQERLNNLQAQISSAFTTAGKNDGVTNTSISLYDQINDNLTKMLGSKIGGTSLFPSIIAADKSRRIEFKGFELFEARIEEINDVVSIPAFVTEKFVEYFEDEYNRMKVVAKENVELDENSKVIHYHGETGNGLKSQLFPELNHNSKTNKEEYKRVLRLLYKDGKPLESNGVLGFSGEQRVAVQAAVQLALTDRYQETVTELRKLNKDTKVNQKLKNAYKNEGGIPAMAGDYLINGLISTIEYTKLFSGDPAYYKNNEDLIKRIPSTYTDGLQLALETSDDMKFNMAVVQNVDVASRYQKVIYDSLKDKSIAYAYGKKADGTGSNVNTTDAQAWITPRRWKFLKERLGQWTNDHDSVYAKMLNGKPLEDKEMKLAAQPLKGVYFEINNGVPTYLKYSQAVIIPAMAKGTPMGRLLDKMQGPIVNGKYTIPTHEETHEVITLDGVKVGAIAPTKIHEGNTTDLAAEFDLNPKLLNNKGWKLQQDLPVKTMHETNIGSQIQKNILEGLKLDGKYKVGGEEKKIDGSDLLQRIHDSIGALVDIGQKELNQKLGIINANITDKDPLYEVMISEFKSRGGNENIIQALEAGTPFDAIPQIAGRIDSILMSVFNRAMTKISTEGGSFIQVSPFGFEKIGNKAKEISTEDILKEVSLDELKSSVNSRLLQEKIDNLDRKSIETAYNQAKAYRKLEENSNKNKELSELRDSLKSEKTTTTGSVLTITNEDNISEYKVVVTDRLDREDDVLLTVKTSKGKEYKISVNPDNSTKTGYIEDFVLNGSKDVYESILKKIDSLRSEISKGEDTSDYWIDYFEKDNSPKASKSNIVIISDRYDKEGLQPPRREKGTGRTLPGQVMMPHTLAMKLLRKSGIPLDRVGLNGNPTWEQLFADPLTRELVGYRIPNQGMSSNDTLEIVGILPATMGDSIIGYDGIPAKTGSDFDIDKMYVMAPNLLYDKKNGSFELINEENKQYYKGNKSPDKLVAQNNVLRLYTDILQSDNTYDNMMTSIDSQDLKNDINELHGKPDDSNLSLFSPITQLRIKMNYMSGNMGVALTANQLVDHVANQSLDIKVNLDLGLGIRVERQVGSVNHGGLSTTKLTKMDANEFGRSISQTLSEFLNAYVDIAKDSYISRGNHNDVTANTAFMLVRAGVPMKRINRIIGQPILKEYVALVKKRDSITSNPIVITLEDGSTIPATPYEFLRHKYDISPGTKDESRFTLTSITDKQLADRIQGEKSDFIDSVVLNSFEFFENKATQWTDAVLAAKIDVKGGGGSPVQMHIARNKILRAVTSGFVDGYETKFQGTALGHYDDALWYTDEVLEKSEILLSGTASAKRIMDKAANEMTREDKLLNEKLGKVINKSLYSYLMSSSNIMQSNRMNFKSLFENLPNKIGDLKATSDNFLIQELEIHSSGGYDFLGINGKSKPALYENDIYRAWMDLYEDPDTKALAVNLVRYAYSQSGYQMNLNQFFTHIPHEILRDEGVNAEVNGFFTKVKIIAESPKTFLEQVYRHESNNTEIVPRINEFEMTGATLDTDYGFTGTPAFNQKYKRYDGSLANTWAPSFVSMKLMTGEVGLFKKISTTDGKNSEGVFEADLVQPIYERTFEMGYKSGKNRVFEYSYDNNLKSSILPENQFSKEELNEIKRVRHNNLTGIFVEQETQTLEENFMDVESFKQEVEDIAGGDMSFESDQEHNAVPFTINPEMFKQIKKDKEIKDPPCKKKGGDNNQLNLF